MMYVVEAASVSAETMKLTVISWNGARWTIDALPEFTVEKLKLMALCHFYEAMDSFKVADRFKLILVSDGRTLLEEGTVRDETLADNDELLLIRRRLPPKSASLSKEKDEKIHGPSDTEIQKLTAGVSPKNMDVVPEDSPIIVDFHSELRKILVSLVQTSEKILRHHPDVVELFKEVAKEGNKENSVYVDPDALKQLTDMGFSREIAIEALRLNCNAESAAEWLLSQGVEESSSLNVSDQPSMSHHPLSGSNTSAQENTINCDASLSGSSTIEDEDDEEKESQNPVVKMLQCFRAYKRKIFRPNRTALSSLKEMGFSESDILDALRISGNNQDSACEWLLSDKKLNFDDIEQGLDLDGPIYKAIMENPVVQLGLCNPKTFLALLHMLENPNSACRWLSDPDTAPILSQIFRIYHAEKHSLQLARPFLH